MGQERDFPPRRSSEAADFLKNVYFSAEGSSHAFDEKKVSSACIILGILSSVFGFFSAGNTGESDRFAVRKPAEERFYDLIPIQSFLENEYLVIGSLLAFEIGLSQVSVGMSLFGIIAVLICFFMGSLQVRVSILHIVALVMGSHVRVKEHAQGQSSSGTAGGKGAGNVDEHRNGSRDGGDENGRLGNEGSHSGIGGGGQRRGNGDDDDNDGRKMVGNVENGGGGNPSLEQIANIFLPIILQAISIIMGIDEAQLSTTGRVIRYFSTIINLLGFLCCAAVLCEPHTNPRVSRILNPIAGILSRIGSALAVLGFISMMAINIPLHLSWVIGLAFLAVLAIFVFDLL
ncbi:hypothetical protein ACB094_04G022400 [Castanea mollissima]